MRLTASRAGGDQERSARMARGFGLLIIQFFSSMYSIHSVSGKSVFWKNKTVIAVVFLFIASFANSVFGIGAGLPVEYRETLGGPVVPSVFAASVGDEYSAGFGASSVILTFDNALVGESGQSLADIPSVDAVVFASRLSFPARGINWGIAHARNAVDISGICGSPIYAVAPGQVIAARAGWEGGYGNYVDIDHGYGVVTRYAHLENMLVVKGQMVAAGDVIASMGNTGNSTGCHVHFEVRGSVGMPNPFVRK